MDPPETTTRQYSTPELITGSHTGIVLEDDIMEHISYTGNANNREDDNDLTTPLGWDAIVSRGDDDRDDSSSSSDDTSSI